jgi:hypothetical protein
MRIHLLSLADMKKQRTEKAFVVPIGWATTKELTQPICFWIIYKLELRNTCWASWWGQSLLQYLNLCDTMAFDRPLEADQVDDLNLFSMLLRAPILGTLIWILGGDTSRKEEEEARRREDIQSFQRGKTHSSTRPCLFRDLLKNRPRKSALKKKSSRMVGTEVSDQCDSVGNSNVSRFNTKVWK